MRVGQVKSDMRVRAGVAPRVASGDPAGAKGKAAGGASFGKGLGSRVRYHDDAIIPRLP